MNQIIDEPKSGLLPTGTTAFYTMIGTPIIQVKSPLFYNRYFAENKIDAIMIAMDVPIDQVKTHFSHIRSIKNFRGGIVTIPHKQAAFDYMNEVSKRAEDLGAVNVFRVEDGRLIGDMVDGLGFMVAVNAHGFSVKDKRVAVIGGGGAGTAVAHAMVESGVNEITIKEIDTKRHTPLMKLLKNVNPNIRISFDLVSLEGFDCVVNATPIGMNDDPNLPFPTDTLSASTFVADVVTHPKLTPWLAAALQKGCRIQYGIEMVYGQFGLMGRHLGLEIPESEGLTFFQGD